MQQKILNQLLLNLDQHHTKDLYLDMVDHLIHLEEAQDHFCKFRLYIFVNGALITGVMVAFSGIIGFVGLMVPHIARMLVGGDYTRVILASALIGAIFLL